MLNCLNLAQGSVVKAFSGQSHFELMTSLTNAGVTVTSDVVVDELGELVVATDVTVVSRGTFVVGKVAVLEVSLAIVGVISEPLEGVPVFAGETVVNDGDFDVMETAVLPV